MKRKRGRPYQGADMKISTMIPKATHRKLKVFAASEGKTMAATVREILIKSFELS